MSEQLYRKIVNFTNTWSTTTWSNPPYFDGGKVQTLGTDIYYLKNTYFFKYNKLTNEWENNYPNNYPNNNGGYSGTVWSDGEYIYLSSYSDKQYVLDKSTNTWVPKTWNGFTDILGQYIWTDGEHIYYSAGSNQYVLDKSTDTWVTKTWNGYTPGEGTRIWSDGEHIYYSTGSKQYVLDKSTDTWAQKAWNISNIEATDIWFVKDNIYYSNGSSQYKLNKNTDEWDIVTWNGLSDFRGYYIWSDGSNVYYSNENTQYVLNNAVTYEPVTIPESIKVKDSQGIWHTVKGISVRTHSGSGAATVKLDTKVPCLTANGDVVIMYDADGNILAHKSDIGNAAAITRFAMYEIRNIYTGETCPFNTSDVNAEQVSSIYVDGEGYLAYNDADDTEGENPRQMLEWNSLNEATIDFASIAGYPRYS